MKTRIIALLTAGLLACEGLALSACSSSASPSSSSSDTAAASESADTTAAAETTTEDEYGYVKNLKDGADLGGETVNFIAKNDGTESMILNDIWSDGENGVKLNDAVYSRNQKVSELYNCVIACVGKDESSEISTAVKKDVMSASGAYDIIDDNTSNMASMFDGGYLVEFGDIPYIDLTQPWWVTSANANFSVANKHYVLLSSLNHFANAVSWCVMFNKYLAEGYGITDLYELARSGDWTLDKMSEYMKNVPVDSNGSGVTDGDDMFGCMSQSFDSMALTTAFGMDYFKKDADDLPVFTLDDEANIDRFNKIFDFMDDRAAVCVVNDYSSSYDDVWTDLWCGGFKNDRALFMFNALVNLMDYSDMEHDFGLLPMPKYDDAQENYRSITSFWFTTSLAVSVAHKVPAEDVGLVLEAMSYLSYKDVSSAYYDTYLTNRYIRDDESVEMMDLIIKDKYYDVGFLFNWGNAMQLASTVVASRENTFVSALAKNKSAIEKAVTKTVKKMKG